MELIENGLSVKPVSVKKVIDVLYEKPIVDRTKMCDYAGVKEGTMRNIIKALLEREIITVTKEDSKRKILRFQKYLDLFME